MKDPTEKKTVTEEESGLHNSDFYMLFFFGAALGVLAFLITYGTSILDLANDKWILRNTDIDIKQHYIGLLHYLNAPWSFPLGCMDTLSYPYTMSIVWTDSIPIFCVFTKLLKGLLPTTPQLFGWYGLLTFALNGGFGAILTFRVTKNRTLSLFSSFFFIFSFPVLQRLFYHTSLAAHYIISAALYYFYSDIKRSPLKRGIIYGFFGFLCVSIHSYFLPFAGVILLADTVKTYITEVPDKKNIMGLVKTGIPLLSFCIVALFSLYFYGAFSTPVNHAGFSLGEFNANLNTFYNSLGDGRLPGLKNKYNTQYEGFGYLGLGVLIMCAVSALILIQKSVRLISENKLKVFMKSHVKILLTVCMFIIFFIMAVVPEADLDEVTLIPGIFPHSIKRILGVFRSNGRFIWGDIYILILSSVYVLNKKAGEKVLCVIVSVCLILQVFDISPMIIKKREYYTGTYDDFDLLGKYVPEDIYDHIVMTFDNGDLKMNFAYYAALNHKTMNRFYFARDIDSVINEKLDEYKKEAVEGRPDERTVYIFNAETMKEWEAAPLHTEKVNDDLFFGYRVPEISTSTRQ